MVSPSNKIIDVADIKKIWQLFSKYWYIYIGFLIIAFIISLLYIHEATSIYQAKITLILESEEESNIQNVLGGLAGRSMYQFNSFKEIANEKRIIKSSDLINQALNRLDFDISYFLIGKIQITEKYKKTPFTVKLHKKNGQQYAGPYDIKIINANKYRLIIDGTNFNYNKTHSFNHPIKTKYFYFALYKNSRLTNLLNDKNIELEDVKFSFNINNRQNLIKKYNRVLNVSNTDFSDILDITCEDEIPERAIDFLDTLAAIYLENSLKRKITINAKTIRFIDQQLDEVVKKLNQVEIELERYKSQNFMLNLEQAQSAYFGQLLSYETQKVRLRMQHKLVDYLYIYLNSNEDNYNFSPALLKEENLPYLEEYFKQLFDLQQKRKNTLSNTTDKSFTTQQIEKQIKNIKEDILLYLQNIKTSIPLNIKAIDAQIEEYKKHIQKIPQAERMLVNIQRKLKVNEEIYLYLLEKKAEAIIAQGGIISDKSIIENARSLGIIKPNQERIILSSLGIGIILSLLSVFIREIFFKTIRNKKELEDLTTFPILGVIGKAPASYKEHVKVTQHPKTPIAEAFRSIRTNLDYLAPELKSKIILITSSMAKEGKTFCAANIASMLAKANKKVLLLGLDLHKPTLHRIFKTNNDHGFTSFLIGKSSEKDIIKHIETENMDIVLAGPVPPNPSELLLNPKLDQFIQKVREKYDYIIIDTPPVSMITDALVLMKKTDINLYVIRANKAKREYIEQAHEIVERHHPGNFGFILNGVKEKTKPYKYYY